MATRERSARFFRISRHRPRTTFPPPRLIDAYPHPPPDDAATSEAACANCGAALAGAFCHRCGQERGAAGRSGYLRKVLADAASIDGKAVSSLRDLVFRPGFLTHE